jgi:hypothetical protein
MCSPVKNGTFKDLLCGQREGHRIRENIDSQKGKPMAMISFTQDFWKPLKIAMFNSHVFFLGGGGVKYLMDLIWICCLPSGNQTWQQNSLHLFGRFSLYQTSFSILKPWFTWDFHGFFHFFRRFSIGFPPPPPRCDFATTCLYTPGAGGLIGLGVFICALQ